MKAVLISIQPKWCELIAQGQKTVEVRKTKPKLETPFKVYIYRTKGVVKHIVNGKWFYMHVGGSVIGEFICDRIDQADVDRQKSIAEAACLSLTEMWKYAGGGSAYDLFGWHISNLMIYDKPKELSDFQKPSIPGEFWPSDISVKRPPQSWCYVEEVRP